VIFNGRACYNKATDILIPNQLFITQFEKINSDGTHLVVILVTMTLRKDYLLTKAACEPGELFPCPKGLDSNFPEVLVGELSKRLEVNLVS
jgi:hypothetical protein